MFQSFRRPSTSILFRGGCHGSSTEFKDQRMRRTFRRSGLGNKARAEKEWMRWKLHNLCFTILVVPANAEPGSLELLHVCGIQTEATIECLSGSQFGENARSLGAWGDEGVISLSCKRATQWRYDEAGSIGIRLRMRRITDLHNVASVFDDTILKYPACTQKRDAL